MKIARQWIDRETGLEIDGYLTYYPMEGFHMFSFLNKSNAQGIVVLVLVVVFTAIGLWFGAPPDAANAGTFGDVLKAFAREPQTRTIFAAILADVVTGVIAALRVGTFDGQRLAGFLGSNVLPYVFGYMLFWFLGYFGLIDALSPAITNGIVSIGFATVMGTLTVSILDNLARASAGSAMPEGSPASATRPSNLQG